MEGMERLREVVGLAPSEMTLEVWVGLLSKERERVQKILMVMREVGVTRKTSGVRKSTGSGRVKKAQGGLAEMLEGLGVHPEAFAKFIEERNREDGKEEKTS